MLLMTDIGHDPDDVIALSYLIEHNVIPDVIIISPGFPSQVQIVSGILTTYGKTTTIVTSKECEDGNYNPGKHKLLMTDAFPHFPITHPKLQFFVDDRALIIGPATNLGGKLRCNLMVFQGGYSPNSVNPLDKFKNKNAVPSFNPNGSRDDFNLLLKSEEIKVKKYVGKNVCHGYTKKTLSTQWQPRNKKIKAFWDQLKDNKAMHDVLAAQCLLDHSNFIWEKAKPIWYNGKLSTQPTSENIFTLIGMGQIGYE